MRDDFQPLTENERIAAEILKGITYRPGWKIRLSRVHEYFEEPVCQLEFHIITPDADRLGSQSVLRSDYRLYALLWFGNGRVEEGFLHELERAISEVESHERLEWLRYGGTCVWDPHPGGGSVSHPSGKPHLQRNLTS